MPDRRAVTRTRLHSGDVDAGFEVGGCEGGEVVLATFDDDADGVVLANDVATGVLGRDDD